MVSVQNWLRFDNDAPKVWDELLDDIHSATSLLNFWKKLKACLFTKAYQPEVLLYFPINCGVDRSFCVSGLCLLYLEIKCSESHIKRELEKDNELLNFLIIQKWLCRYWFFCTLL